MDFSASAGLLAKDTVAGAVDYRGRPVSRSNSGGWRSAILIIGVEMAERFAFYGVQCNLIQYLTGPLHESTAEAAVNVNVWTGTAAMLPLLGGALADSFLGRYNMIVVASIFYILSLGFLSLSAGLPWLRAPDSTNAIPPTSFQVVSFFSALYVMAVAQGGHKPVMQAFGADQFDAGDRHESRARSSFFNWWYFTIQLGILLSLSIVTYIQDKVSWSLGFGISCLAMLVALIVFLLGTTTYRHIPRPSEEKKILEKMRGSCDSDHDQNASWTQDRKADARILLKLVPIWVACLVFAIVFAQTSTLFTKQGSTMVRKIGSHFEIPPASLQMFKCVTIILILPLYDRLFVPSMRAVTGLQSGITMLQRIGIGIFLSTVSMVVAGALEARRLAVARESGMVDVAGSIVPMSVWWLIPQYLLAGAADALAMVGLQEFFYVEVPDGLRSVGMALYLSIFGIGNFLSGLLVSAIDTITAAAWGESWFCNNLNRAHLDYFYGLLAGLSAVGLGLYVYCAKLYLYKTKSKDHQRMHIEDGA